HAGIALLASILSCNTPATPAGRVLSNGLAARRSQSAAGLAAVPCWLCARAGKTHHTVMMIATNSNRIACSLRTPMFAHSVTVSTNRPKHRTGIEQRPGASAKPHALEGGPLPRACLGNCPGHLTI